jgi:two-component system chemotaxis response regulator CheY
MTTLIVDDSASMRQLVGFTLRQAGHEVVEGANGQEALGKLNGSKVDLVVTDLNMPVMDGIGLIKALRDRPESRFTPILMLTTESQEVKKREGQAAGATGWIVKPFNPEQLLRTIARVAPR